MGVTIVLFYFSSRDTIIWWRPTVSTLLRTIVVWPYSMFIPRAGPRSFKKSAEQPVVAAYHYENHVLSSLIYGGHAHSLVDKNSAWRKPTVLDFQVFNVIAFLLKLPNQSCQWRMLETFLQFSWCCFTWTSPARNSILLSRFTWNVRGASFRLQLSVGQQKFLRFLASNKFISSITHLCEHIFAPKNIKCSIRSDRNERQKQKRLLGVLVSSLYPLYPPHSSDTAFTAARKATCTAIIYPAPNMFLRPSWQETHIPLPIRWIMLPNTA